MVCARSQNSLKKKWHYISIRKHVAIAGQARRICPVWSDGTVPEEGIRISRIDNTMHCTGVLHGELAFASTRQPRQDREVFSGVKIQACMVALDQPIRIMPALMFDRCPDLRDGNLGWHAP